VAGRHEFGVFVGPQPLFAIRRQGDLRRGVGKVAGQPGEIVLRGLYDGAGVGVLLLAVRQEDDEVLLARVDDWARIVAGGGIAVFSAGCERTAGERQPSLPRDVNVSAGVGFHFAIAGIGLVPLEVLI